jgi:cell division protein FtsB
MPGRRNTAEPQDSQEGTSFRFRPAYVILLLCMALFAFKFIQKTQEIRALAAQAAAVRYQNERTAAENDQLRREIGYYRTPNYIENTARTYGFARPGDVPIQTQPVNPRIVAVRAAPLPAPSMATPVWKQWWLAFFP